MRIGFKINRNLKANQKLFESRKTKVTDTLFLEIVWLQKVINQGIASYRKEFKKENKTIK